ncbi:DsbA family protein [Bradyrhizobium sp. INPA03-11B]|uniref:2-hydroxychromene-2-carboxylate isomerase n=1 Tax=Bradyrhizobium sp. INPA03-11B TaxID=418598 RepID=UPI00338FCA3C
MTTAIEVFYDFRSPYAYFASHRLRGDAIVRRGYDWRWCPVSIDVLLNLQTGREPWAAYVDPLPGPKRAHLIADVRRLAAYHRLPLRAPKPPRPNSVPALCLACLLDDRERQGFSFAVFDALWQEQQDISTPEVLRACLSRAGVGSDLLDAAFDDAARAGLAEATRQAYACGVFGVPSFVVGDEVFFGSDRLDLLLWKIES